MEFQREKAKELIKFFNQQKAEKVYQDQACAPSPRALRQKTSFVVAGASSSRFKILQDPPEQY